MDDEHLVGLMTGHGGRRRATGRSYDRPWMTVSSFFKGPSMEEAGAGVLLFVQGFPAFGKDKRRPTTLRGTEQGEMTGQGGDDRPCTSFIFTAWPCNPLATCCRNPTAA
ncbi:hypothetical protein Dimus_021212, partial [Dionaea muscipula]